MCRQRMGCAGVGLYNYLQGEVSDRPPSNEKAPKALHEN